MFPLPGQSEPVHLYPIKSEAWAVPIMHRGGVIKYIEVPVHQVADADNKIFGVVAMNPGDQQIYATLLTRGTAAQLYYQISPEDDQSGAAHKASALTAAELKTAQRCALMDSGVDPNAAGLAALTATLGPTEPALLKGGLMAESTQAFREIQMIMVSSGDFTDGRNDGQVAAQIASIVSGANIYYEPLKLFISLAGLQIYQRGAADPYNDATQHADALEMHDTLANQWSGRPIPEHDMASVLAKGSFKFSGQSILGLAYQAVSCEVPDFAFLFATQGQRNASGELSLVSTFAHEIGHILGMGHDDTLYPQGHSLMYSFSNPNSFGFSQLSVDQYLNYAGPGQVAGACLTEKEPPPGNGGVPTPVPINHAPTFNDSVPNIIEVEEKIPAQFDVSAIDPDGDAVKFEHLSSSTLRKARGAKLKISAASAHFSWPKPTRGSFTFEFRARDSKGLSTNQKVLLRIVPRNNPPQLLFAETVPSSSSDHLDVTFTARDPEGAPVALDVSGAPAGTMFVFGPGSVRMQTPGFDDKHVYVVRASDGRKITEKAVTISQPTVSLLNNNTIRWPGAPRQAVRPLDFDHNSQPEFTIYNSDTGIWEHRACDGSVTSTAQWGGFIGDYPLAYKKDGVDKRAIYRIVNGQAYWFVDDDKDPEIVQWGLPRDIPVPGDFDGDGTTDRAVYRDKDSRWYINFSKSGSQTLTDARSTLYPNALRYPLAGDIDGDGRDDRVFFMRRADQSVYFEVLLATGEQRGFVLDEGKITDTFAPLLADLDGDGRDDLAVRVGAGTIKSMLSTTAAVSTQNTGAGMSAMLSATDCNSDGVFEVAAIDPLNTEARYNSAGTTSISALVASLSRSAETLDAAALRFAYGVQRAAFGDTDGDGISNFAVFRQETDGNGGKWFDRSRNATFQAHSAIPLAGGFGTALDVSGSGKSALTYYKDGTWISQSQDGNRNMYFWGELDDIPMPGDYNGDGISDLGIFRPRDGTWWLLLKTPVGDAAQTMFWGQEGDVPVAADYNGDGVTDVAVWRPSNGIWYVRYDASNTDAVQWGLNGDVPLPADYLGMGHAQFALWRPSEGNWYLRSGDSAGVEQWGLGTDYPLAGLDFNGDARADLVVWRPSNGSWYVKSLSRLGNSTSVTSWGLANDLPLGNARSLLP